MKPEELRSLPVSQLLTPAKSFRAGDPISQAIGYMKDAKLSEVFIEEQTGITVATIRDLLRVQNVKTKISTIATHVPKLNPNNVVSDAALIMFEHRVKSLPIFEKSNFTGQITSQSILGKLMETELNSRVSRIMTPNPVCIESDETVSKARSEMMKLRVDQLPVLKRGKLNGVIESSSIVFNLLPPPDRSVAGDWRNARLDVPVENFSTISSVTNEASDSVSDAFRTMDQASSSYSVVLNMGEIQGIVTHRDFMRFLTRPTSPLETPMYIVGLPEEPFEAEATRAKFSQVVKYLGRSIPNITEARAIIKSGGTKAAKRKYQVRVFAIMPGKRLSYDAFGYGLPDIFDELSSWAKGLASKVGREKKRRRTSVRKIASA